jgi:YVTN family beta-propeller protein
MPSARAHPVLLAAIGLFALACGSSDSSPTSEPEVPVTPPPATWTSPFPDASVLVANGGSRTLSVIDAARLEVIRTIDIDPVLRPHHLSLSFHRRALLISTSSTDLSAGHGASTGGHAGPGGENPQSRIYMLDITNGELRKFLEIDATVHNAAFSHAEDDPIVLGMMEHGMIAAYDPADSKELWTLDIGDMPLEVSPTRSGAFAFAALAGGNSIAVIDLKTRVQVASVDVGETPIGAWLSSTSAYVTNEASGSVSVISLETKELRASFDVGGMPGQAFATPDESELWVALEDQGKLRIVDPNSGATIADVAAGTKPHGIAFEPNGDRVFVTDEASASVLVFRVSTRELLKTITVGEQPNGIVWMKVPAK